MPHLLVTQLRFARQEFMRGLEGVSPEDALRRFGPMNSIGWIVGHLASQENAYWVYLGQGQRLFPDLRKQVGTGMPASTPPLEEMWATWRAITSSADPFLDTLTSEKLETFFLRDGKPIDESIGTLLMRNIYHYWYHLGEALAIRQMLGHTDLPQFVGEINQAPYFKG
jgi:uncharacterized damage-inducible protein DinB